MSRIKPLIAVIALMTMAACGDSNPKASPSPSVSFPNPRLALVSPERGSTIAAGDVTVEIRVEDFKLVSKFGQPAAVGEGHVHYFLDVFDTDISTDPDTVAQPPKGAGSYAPAVTTTYTWKNVKPGSHTFAALLVDNDHTPLAGFEHTQVAAEAKVTVR